MKTVGEIAGELIEPIVDTGSTISIISEELKNKLPEDIITVKPKSKVIVTTANRGQMDYKEQAQVSFKLGEKDFTQEMAVIKDFPYKMLLGNDFLLTANN